LREAVEHYQAGRLAHQSGNNEMAVALMEKAVAADPSRPEYHNDLGAVYVALGRANDAVRAYRAAAALAPGFALVQYNLGNTLWSIGQLQEAEQSYRRAVALDPDFALAHSNLGSALNELGRVQEAEESLGRAVALLPDYAEAHSNLGNVRLTLGRLAEAERSHRQAVALRPELAIVHSNLGCLLLALGRLEEAEQSNRRALALEPGLFDAHCNLGNALASLGRLDEAEQSYRQALALRPEFATAHFNLGNVLMELGRLPEAERSYRQAVALRHDYADAHTGLGNALHEQHRREEALASHRRAAELRPDAFQTRFASCIRQIPILYGAPGDIDNARTRYAASLAALRADLRLDTPRAVIDAAEAVGNALPFFLAYQGMNNRELHSRYGDLVCTVMAAWLRLQDLPPPAPRAGAPRRIRIGIVSAHFRQGSVWNVLTRGIVIGFDRTKFELFGYSTSRSRDSETSFAEASLDGYRQGPWPLRRWLDLIRNDAPDVLIYPEIGMDPMTTKLAALRLAPVQAAMGGHPDTTGLPTIDYYLSGELYEPHGAQAHYSERLVTLPNLGCSFRPLPVEPADFDLAAHGIPERDGCVLLLSCQAAVFKYLPNYDDVFPRIASAVRNCCIVFIRVDKLFDQFYERLEAAFAASGLDIRQYCVVIDALPKDAFFGLMTKADIYLDTLSFSGFTTAFQALQCRLPIVTLEGEFMRGRLASGLLRRIGIAETIAADVDEYVSIATGLARDSTRRTALKARIASQLPVAFHDMAPLRAMERFFEEAVIESARRGKE
jgi:protein O-GlcNAc transferase